MRCVALLFGVLALVIGAASPASAKFWGCKDERGKVLAQWTTDSHGHRISGSRYTHDFAARPRHPKASYGSRRYWNERPRW